MKKPIRYWMSGCAAVVSLALGGVVDAWADDTDPRPGIWQTSRFDMPNTLERLKACAPGHGLSVMACWAPTAGSVEARRTHGAAAGRSASRRSVLIFATRDGSTPVLMAGEGSRPALPLSVHLRLRDDGQVEVLLPAPYLGEELPSEVVRELIDLPGLVAQALA